MLKLVPTVQTIYSRKELCKALIKVWISEYKSVPSKASVGVIIAQNMIETGGKYFWNNNWGNSKVGQDVPNQEIKYMMLKGTWEIIGNRRVVFEPPHPATWFRAFDTLEEGVRHHFDLLKNKRYRIAWEAVEKGDIALFATRLKQQGYFTAPVQDYINGMMAHYKIYDKSGDYEKALAEIQSEPTYIAPPLQPFIEVEPIFPPLGEIVVDNDSNSDKNNKIAQKSFIQKILDIILSWFKKS